MARKGCFPWIGRKDQGRIKFERDSKCRRCKAHSAPSTPRGSREARNRPMAPRRYRRKPRGCFSRGPISTNAKYRDKRLNINPRALPIVLHPDHSPREQIVLLACQSPRRGCVDHRCHKHRGYYSPFHLANLTCRIIKLRTAADSNEES